MKKLMLSVFALAAFVLGANAAGNVATGTALGKAELIQTIAIANVTDAPNSNGNLEFGKIAITTGEVGTVSITPAADGSFTPSVTGGATLVAGTTRSSAAFSVSGQTNRLYSITLPSTVTISDGSSHDLTLDNFNSSKGASATVSATAASNVFYVGAKLNIDATDPVGSYSGSFSVTVTYN